jgi:hypothetical protein
MINPLFVFMPVSVSYNLMYLYFYLFGAISIAGTWFSNYLVMELIKKQKFASNLQDIAYT